MGRRIGRVSLPIALLLILAMLVVITIPESTSAYTPHDPILVDGNSGFNSTNGVVGGGGTESDPYIIEGWEIDASVVHGMDVRNTDAYFVIRDVFIHSGYPSFSGIALLNVMNARVENVTISDCGYGIHVDSSSRVVLDGNEMTHNFGAIDLRHSDNITVAGNLVGLDTDQTIYVSYSSNVTVEGNEIYPGDWNGVHLYYSSNATVADNWIAGGGHRGVFSEGSDAVHIKSNEIFGCFYGISIDSSTRVIIEYNNVHGNTIGAFLRLSSQLTVENNTVQANSRQDVDWQLLTEVSFQGNVMGWSGIDILGTVLEHYRTHVITADNLVNGKPVLYYKDCVGLNINGVSVGQMIIANCTDVSITNLEVTGDVVATDLAFVNWAHVETNVMNSTAYGVRMSYSDNATIIGNTFSSTKVGVLSYRSKNITVLANVASRNLESVLCDESSQMTISGNIISEGDGLDIRQCSNISITGNVLLLNDPGISLLDSYDILATGNDIRNNDRAFLISTSTNVTVHHNNFVNNIIGAVDSLGNENSWDDGYPSGGNYWSDYVGMDDCSGPNQDDCPNPDGIGDLPYIIEIDSQDSYPLMEEYIDDSPPDVTILSPSNGDSTVTFTIEVTGQASDTGHNGIQRVEVRTNGGMWANASGTHVWRTVVDLNLGSNEIEARAWDSAGNPSIAHSINISYVPPPNTPPVAVFDLHPVTGDVTTRFTVDASSSWDTEDPSSALEIRWDWEGDGFWDTSWSTTKIDEKQYSDPGSKTIFLEVRDTGGLANTTARAVLVLPVGGDSELPLIIHTPVEKAFVDQSIIIEASITDNVGIASAILYHSPPGSGSWSNTTMNLTDSHHFRAEIPGQLTEGILHYYLEATDASGNSVTDPGTGRSGPYLVEVLLDSDGDGMPDVWEEEYGLDPWDEGDDIQDTDDDGLTNLEEYLAGTSPVDEDTDGDGLTDGEDPDPLTPIRDDSPDDWLLLLTLAVIVTTVIVGALFLWLRRRRRNATAEPEDLT